MPVLGKNGCMSSRNMTINGKPTDAQASWGYISNVVFPPGVRQRARIRGGDALGRARQKLVQQAVMAKQSSGQIQARRILSRWLVAACTRTIVSMLLGGRSRHTGLRPIVVEVT